MPSRVNRLLLVAMLVLALAIPASVASADQPTRFPFVNQDFTADASYCGFPVQVHWVINQQTATLFTPKDPGVVTQAAITGALTAQLTNTVTGKSVVRVFSGRALYTIYADGSYDFVNEGNAIYPFAAATGNPISGYPGIFATLGQSAGRADSTNHVLEFSATGPIENLCATLSS